jgi:NitT/TauT family transport system substrate-binding protein
VDVEVLDNIQFDLIGGAFDGGIGDYVSLFEPNATLFVMEGKGHIVANVGEASGEVPYTGYSVRPQTLQEDPAFVESFLRAVYRAQQWVITASNEEVAEAMMPFFPDANLEVLTAVAKNYRETDAWKTDPILQEEDYNRLLEIMDNAGELRGEAPYAELVDNTIARKIVEE